MQLQPLQLAYYKGLKGTNGALQINFRKPHYYVKSDTRLRNFEGKFIPKEWLEVNPSLTIDDLSLAEGTLFLEITSATGKNVYDWDNKIVMALAVVDMGKLLTVLDGELSEVRIMHDPGAKTAAQGKVQKWLDVSEGEYKGPTGQPLHGITISVTKKDSEGQTRHMVPLTCDDAKVLACCLRVAIPASLGWIG